jgi:F-type H+-transporting ATPase subunit b
MEIILPKFGLFFWTIVIFLIYYFIIAKYAWKPIIASIKKREESIQNALKDAETARQEIQKMNELTEKIHKEALAEKNKIIKEAEELANQKKQLAEQEAANIKAKKLAEVEQEITNMKNSAISEIKNLVGSLSVEIAEKILKEQLKNPKEQEAFAKSELDKINLN